MADCFLLIEHLGPWRFDALAGSGWAPDVIATLAASAARSRARLLLIRRPGRRAPGDIRTWAVVRVGSGALWGRWRDESDLLDAPAALESTAATPSELDPRPLLLVCAHGVHDTCCAVRGRPVASALAERWPDATWECTHVGGDRFAANVVVLPDGTYYGGLDSGTVSDVVAGHLAGRVDVQQLRGSVRWPPPAQVAVAEIHRRWGPFAAQQVWAEQWVSRGPGHWLVAVAAADGRRHRVTVQTTQREPAVLTCAATRATPATDYRITAVTTDDVPQPSRFHNDIPAAEPGSAPP